MGITRIPYSFWNIFRIIYLILVPIGAYWGSKKFEIDLKANLKPLSISVAVGAYFGSLVGYVTLPIIFGNSVTPMESLMSAILWVLLINFNQFHRYFFMAFTGLSLAYFRSHEQPIFQHARDEEIKRSGIEPEQNEQYMILLFLVIIFLGVITIVFSTTLSEFLQLSLFNPAENSFYWVRLIVFVLVSLSVMLLIPIGGYWVGRKINLNLNLRAVCLTILVASYIGSVTGIVSTNLIDGTPLAALLSDILMILTSAFLWMYLLIPFFPAFSGLALAHLRAQNLQIWFLKEFSF